MKKALDNEIPYVSSSLPLEERVRPSDVECFVSAVFTEVVVVVFLIMCAMEPTAFGGIGLLYEGYLFVGFVPFSPWKTVESAVSPADGRDIGSLWRGVQ